MSGLTEDELEALYTVPFFIWTNYDTPEETVDITSLNFLSTMTLERAGIELPAYNKFLADMTKVHLWFMEEEISFEKPIWL